MQLRDDRGLLDRRGQHDRPLARIHPGVEVPHGPVLGVVLGGGVQHEELLAEPVQHLASPEVLEEEAQVVLQSHGGHEAGGRLGGHHLLDSLDHRAQGVHLLVAVRGLAHVRGLREPHSRGVDDFESETPDSFRGGGHLRTATLPQ